jgi:hypothetical protein
MCSVGPKRRRRGKKNLFYFEMNEKKKGWQERDREQ